MLSQNGTSIDPSFLIGLCHPHYYNFNSLLDLQAITSDLFGILLPSEHHFITSQKPLIGLQSVTTPLSTSYKLLTTAPISSFPDFSRLFILDADASNNSIGTVLSQCHNHGREYVIAYASQSLSKSEQNYSVTHRELLAIVTLTNHFVSILLQKCTNHTLSHGLLISRILKGN